MLHARRDYDRFQDPEEEIPEDEPVFLIRGQDMVAPSVLKYYADMAELVGADKELVDAVRKHAELMIDYQYQQGGLVEGVRMPAGKVPDAPMGVLR